jgi:hypothetical protein
VNIFFEVISDVSLACTLIIFFVMIFPFSRPHRRKCGDIVSQRSFEITLLQKALFHEPCI